MANPVYGDFRIDMFMSGNGVGSKKTDQQLDLGFENCYDSGCDDKVELLKNSLIVGSKLPSCRGKEGTWL